MGGMVVGTKRYREAQEAAEKAIAKRKKINRTVARKIHSNNANSKPPNNTVVPVIVGENGGSSSSPSGPTLSAG